MDDVILLKATAENQDRPVWFEMPGSYYIASHPDVNRLVAAFAEIQKGLQLHEKRVVSASEFVIATQILMARIGPTLEQLTGDTPTNGEGS